MAWKGENWDRGVVKLLVRVADALDAGEKPSTALGPLLPVEEAAMIDRLSQALRSDVAALLKRWRSMDGDAREGYMWGVLARWKAKKGY